MTQNELELYFSQCGRIITSRILYDNTTGQTRVTFWQCCYLMLACKRLLWQIARAVYFSYYYLFNYYDSLLMLLLIVEFKLLFYLYLCFLFPFLESFSWLTILFGLQVCLISSQLFILYPLACYRSIIFTCDSLIKNLFRHFPLISFIIIRFWG